jgi:hypothetical protein
VVYVQTFFEAFWNMSLRSACFFDEAFFLVKIKISGLGTALLECQIIRISELSHVGVNRFCSISKFVLLQRF